MNLNRKSLSLKQKIIIFFFIIIVILSIITIFLIKQNWIFSLLSGCISYVLLMTVTFRSISAKIMEKIIEANVEHNSLKSNIYDEVNLPSSQDMGRHDILRQNHPIQNNLNKTEKETFGAKKENKKRLKFIDLSKASLGFELSFSLPRIFAFLCMVLTFGLLIWFDVFFPLIYLFGVFLGVVLVVCGLFAIEIT